MASSLSACRLCVRSLDSRASGPGEGTGKLPRQFGLDNRLETQQEERHLYGVETNSAAPPPPPVLTPAGLEGGSLFCIQGLLELSILRWGSCLLGGDLSDFLEVVKVHFGWVPRWLSPLSSCILLGPSLFCFSGSPCPPVHLFPQPVPRIMVQSALPDGGMPRMAEVSQPGRGGAFTGGCPTYGGWPRCSHCWVHTCAFSF